MAAGQSLTLANFIEGAYIFVEGSVGDTFYIIKQGKVRVFKENAALDSEKQGKTLVPGDFLGLCAVMSGHAYLESAQALTDVRLIAIARKQFETIARFNTPLVIKAINNFTQQLRTMNVAIANALQAESSADDMEILYTSGEFYESVRRPSEACYVYHKYVDQYPHGPNVAAARERLNALVRSDHIAEYNATGSNRGYEKGYFLFAEGEYGEEMFLLVRGKVKLTKIENGTEKEIKTLKPGSIFGDSAIVEPKPREKSAIAQENCAVMAIKRESFPALAASHPQIISLLTAKLADRVWFSHKQLANAQISDPVSRLYDALFMNLEKEKAVFAASTPHSFNFSPEELAKSVGLTGETAKTAVKTLMENDTFFLAAGKLATNSTEEVKKQAESVRSTQKRVKANP